MRPDRMKILRVSREDSWGTWVTTKPVPYRTFSHLWTWN